MSDLKQSTDVTVGIYITNDSDHITGYDDSVTGFASAYAMVEFATGMWAIALLASVDGNDIDVTLTNGTLDVIVTGTVIAATVESGVTTHAALLAALLADNDTIALVRFVTTGDYNGATLFGTISDPSTYVYPLVGGVSGNVVVYIRKASGAWYLTDGDTGHPAIVELIASFSHPGANGILAVPGSFLVKLLASHLDELGDFEIHIPGQTGFNDPANKMFQVVPAAPDVNVTKWLGTAAATPTVAGVPEVDVTHWIGTACATPTTAGVPEVDVTFWRGSAVPIPDISGVPAVDPQYWKGGLIATPAVTGVPEVDVTHWIGTACSTPTVAGVPEVDVIRWQGGVNASLAGDGGVSCNITRLLNSAIATPTVAGVLEVDVTHHLGTAAATPTVAGVPEVDITHWNGTAVAAPTTPGVPRVDVRALEDNVITAASTAADYIAEIQANLSTAAALVIAQADLDDIQTRLPVALIGGQMDSTGGSSESQKLWPSGTSPGGGFLINIALEVGTGPLTDDILNGGTISIRSGTGAGQTRTITDYDAATETATINPIWVIGPGNDSVYDIWVAPTDPAGTAERVALVYSNLSVEISDVMTEVVGIETIPILATSLTKKTQFSSTEDLRIVFPPFIDKTTGDQFLGTDAVTLTIKRPNATLLGTPPVPLFDTDVNLWTTTVAASLFMEGDWLIFAESDESSTQGQNQVLTWGDYVDDIQETRQAALGRWKIDAPLRKLYLYEEDGTTVFKEFDLKDSTGAPSVTQIFERDPI